METKERHFPRRQNLDLNILGSLRRGLPVQHFSYDDDPPSRAELLFRTGIFLGLLAITAAIIATHR